LEKVLVNLAELQKIDSQISEIESLRGDLPQQVEKLELKRESSGLELNTAKAELETCLKERTSLELLVKEQNSKKEKYKVQLYEVKTNREYDAISLEIESVNEQVSEAENKILELLNKEDALKETVDEKTKVFETLEAEFAGKNADLQKLIARTAKEEIALKHERDKVIAKVDKRLVSAYKRIQTKYGNAIVPVVRRACGGCFKALPPQRVLEARKMDKLILCEVCGRMLIWDEVQSEPEE